MTRPALLILASCLLATAARAQDGFPHGGIMGVWFSDTEFSPEYTNIDPIPAPFNMYVALIDAHVATVAGYECGLSLSPDNVFLLQLIVDSNQDFLDPANHIIGFETPKVVPADGAVLLSTVVTLYTGYDVVEITMGPSFPSTGNPQQNPMGWAWDGPMIAANASLEGVHRCDLSSGASGEPDVVATLNGYGSPVDHRHLSAIRELFR